MACTHTHTYIYIYVYVCVLYRQWVLMQDIDLVNLTTWNDNLLLSMFFFATSRDVNAFLFLLMGS